jgi:hypothetical protein
MTHMTQKLTLLLFLAMAVLFACNNDDDDDPTPCGANFNFTSELMQEAQTLQNAAQVYAMDQSTANCQAWVDAYGDYLDAARDLENCAIAAGQQAQYNQAIDDAEEALNQLQC